MNNDLIIEEKLNENDKKEGLIKEYLNNKFYLEINYKNGVEIK
jgi:hypothetical protein